MHSRKKKVDAYAIQWATSRALDTISHFTKMAENYKDDPLKEKRVKENQCKVCFYGSRIGGAAITTTNCAGCDKPLTFGNTNVDALCDECASKHSLCKHCGADRELRPKRRLYPKFGE